MEEYTGLEHRQTLGPFELNFDPYGFSIHLVLREGIKKSWNFPIFLLFQIFHPNFQLSVSICKSQLKLNPIGFVDAQVLCIFLYNKKLDVLP